MCGFGGYGLKAKSLSLQGLATGLGYVVGIRHLLQKRCCCQPLTKSIYSCQPPAPYLVAANRRLHRLVTANRQASGFEQVLVRLQLQVSILNPTTRIRGNLSLPTTGTYVKDRCCHTPNRWAANRRERYVRLLNGYDAFVCAANRLRKTTKRLRCVRYSEPIA